MLFNMNAQYTWKAYAEHELDNNKMIKELRVFHGNGEEFKTFFLKALKEYKEHYFVYRWLQFSRQFDISHLTSNDIYIQTDYGAQPVLDSQDKLNSTGHGVCVISCWVILHSPEDMAYKDKNGITHRFRYFKCDHVRAVTPSTGKSKDQDWFTHCTIFDHLISMYKTEIPELKTIYVWTDGAPTQYKCRQNFFWLTNAYKNHKIRIVHRFGATAQFKGVHDKIGQVAKLVVK
jgi:hypothetical protein